MNNMQQQDKDLLMKDLCGRLLYDVLLSHNTRNHVHKLTNIGKSGMVLITDIVTDKFTTTDVENVKPYLFPFSSMTEEQKKELEELCDMHIPDETYSSYEYKGVRVLYKHASDTGYKLLFNTDVIEWFHKNHIDYQGLIKKGLANDATNLNIYG